MRLHRRVVLAGFTALAASFACTSGGDGGVSGLLSVGLVEVTPDNQSVPVGGTVQFSATVKTESGVVIPGRTITWSSSDNTIATVNSSGLATGVALGGPVRIRATADGVTGDGLLTVRPVPVDHVTVEPPSQGVLVNGQVQFTATALDATNNVLAGRSFLWESSNPDIAAVTTTGLVLGRSEGGPVTITATSEGKSGSGTVSVSTRPPTRLSFVQQPASAVANGPVTPPVKVALQDDLLSTVLGSTNAVTIALAGNPGGATLGGTMVVNAINGIATFNNLILDRAGTGYTLLATSPGLASSTSAPFNVTSGSAFQLALTTAPPATAQSGVAFAPQPVVQLRDAANNPVAQAGIVVTATIASGTGALAGSTSATTNASGAASFTTLALSGLAGNYTLAFGAPGVNAATSGTIVLTAGPAAALAMAAQPPPSGINGVPLSPQPSVQLKDGAGNPVAAAGIAITPSLASGPGLLGPLPLEIGITNAAGVAQFNSLTINGGSGSYTLGFSSPGLTGATSSPIVLGAGAPTQLALTTPPSPAGASGLPLAQQPVVQLRDASNNNVALGGVSITASVSAGGTLLGTATVTTGGTGAASFSGLAIQGLAGNYTLTFSASGLGQVASGPIAISPGTATRLALTTQPSAGAQSGVPLLQQPVVQLQDAAGNPVASVGVLVTATIAAGPGGTLGGTATIATSSFGIAAFSNLVITGPAGNYALAFAATGLTSATSGTISVGAGGATQLTLTTPPSAAAQSGVAFAQQPVLQLRDASNNPVSQAGVVVTATIASGGGTLGGTATATTNSTGVAAFTTLAISGTIGNRTLAFSAPTLTGATSGTIVLGPGPASQLTITTQPSSAAQSGVVFPQQPVVQLRDASGNAVSQGGTLVTAAIATGGGTLGGTVAVATSAAGTATFTDLAITGTAGDRTLSFSATGLSGATSGAVTVTAGAASTLSISTQPSSSAQNGVAFPQQPVLQLRDASNNPVSTAGVVVTAAINTGGGVLGGTVTASTNGSGVATFTNLQITGTVGDRTLIFTATGFTSITSGTITLTAGAASKLALTTQPSSTAQSGVAFPQQPVLQLQDVSGNAVSQSGTVVTATIASGGGTLGGTATATTSASGVASFANLAITGTIGTRTLGFAATGLAGATSAGIALTAGPASQLTITTQPSSSAQSGVAFPQQPVLQLRDASGNAASQSGVLVTATIASGGGSLGGTTTASTNASGVVTFANLAISGTVGSRTLNFTAATLSGVVSNAIAITAGPASQLTITTQPSSSAQSGVAIPQQPVLQLRDASGNAVSQSGTVVTAAIASGGGTLGGTATASTNASGVATFADLAISGTIGSRTLTFSGSGLTSVTSDAIALTAGPASQLTITTQPSTSAQSGVAFAQQPVLQVRDASGNAVSQGGTVVTAAIATGGGTLGGTTTATTNASGVATFTNLSITGTAGDRTLSFTATGLTSATSGTITVSAGSGSQLSITRQPSTTAQSGVAFATQPRVQLLDASNNAVNQAGVVITAAIASGGGTLGGTLTATTNGSGTATFSNLMITGTLGSRTLVFTATGFTSATSNPISITAGAAAQLAVATQPSSSAQSGVAFPTQPAIQIQDASGNPVSQSGTTVTASIASGGGTLGGTLTATTSASGLATFTDLRITGTIGARTLAFAATGLTGATSGTITLTAGPASQLTITTQPSSAAQSGIAFAQQPVLQLRDASNNAVSQPGVVVTAAIATGGGALGGTLTATTDGGGAATFTNLSITGTVGARTLQFSAPSVTSATSGTITLSAGLASQLTIATQPSSSAASGAVFATQPAIQLKDAAGNAVSQAGVTVTAAIASGGGTLGGTATASTDGSGLATFTGLSITGTAGDRTLQFTATGLASVTSGTISITAGGGSVLSIATPPSGTAVNGTAFAQQPAIQLRDASNNPVSQAGVSVTAAINTGAGTLGGTLTASTNASGLATFTDLEITGATGDRTLVFTATGFSSVTSGTITLTAGAATHLGLTTQPSASAQSGVAFPQQPVVQLLDQSENPASQAGVTVTAAIASGGGTLGGNVGATTNASGVATFTDLKITGAVGARTLQFTATGLTAVTSGTITLTAGPASQLTITTQPSSSAASGSSFAQQPVLQLRDASGNAVSQAGVGVTAAIATGTGGTLSGGTVVFTDANGVATYTNLVLTGTAGDFTLGFSASGVTGATSGTISLTAGTGNKLALTTQPSASAQNGVIFGQQPVVQVQDGSGNPVAQSGVVVTATIQTGGGTLGGTTSATTNGSGVATFTDLKITGTAGDRTLLFAAAGYVSVASGTITLTAGAATQLAIATPPSSSAQSGVAFAQQPAIQLQDVSGNPVSQASVVITAAIASGGGTLGGTTTASTAGNGLATFTDLSITGTPGARTLSFSATGLTGATSGTITLSAGPASQLAILTQPVGGASGAQLATQPVIAIRDGAGNQVTGDNTTQVSVAIFSGAGGTLSGTQTVTASGGQASFTNLALSGTVGVNYVLRFTSSPALTAVNSNNVTVTAGAASQLAIATQPVGGASGAALATQPVVAIKDGSGNTVTGDNTTQVSVAIFSGAGGTLGGTQTRTAVAGVATFDDLTLAGTVGTNYVLQFTSSPGLTAANSNNVTVTAGAASQLAITTQPVGGTSGSALATQPVIAIRDAQGNTVTGDNATQVTVAISSGAGGTLGGTTTRTASAGVVTFDNVTLAGTIGVNYVLQFTSSPPLTAANSNNVTVTAGAATQLNYDQQPSAAASSGQAFVQQPRLLLRDAANNPVGGSLVTATITGAPGGVSLIGTTTATTDGSGIAAFTDLGLSGTAASYTLTFTAGAVTSAASNAIALGAGNATQLAITTQPVGAASGTALATQPVVAIRDGAGNLVTGDNATQVTVAIFSGAGGTLGGTTTRTASAGVVTFDDVTLAGTVGVNYVLQFTSSPALTPASSTNVTVTAGAAAQLAITTQPVGGATGAALATQPVIAIRDAQGNTITGDNTTQVSVAIFSGAGGTLGGTQTRTASAGVATFNDLTLSGTVGVNYVLQFTSSPVLTAANSANVTVTSGPATQLAITTQPVGGASGAALATQPVVAIRDADGNLVTGDNATQVTVAILSGAGGTLGGTTTRTASAGIVTFDNLTLAGTVGVNYVLQFTSSPALTSASSNNVTVTAGSATQLAITTQPVGAASGTALATQPVIAIRDGAGNLVTGDNATQVTVAIFSGTGGTLGGTQTVTAVGGIVTFNDLTLAGTVGVDYVLRFTSSPALTPANSGNVTVTAGAASQLIITTQPGATATSGALLSPQPVIQVADASGNAVAGSGVSITATLNKVGGNPVLTGTVTLATNGSGVVTYTDLVITGNSTATLTFTATGLTPVTSIVITTH